MTTSVHSGEDAVIPTEQANKPSASVADVLNRAADLIEPEGAWTQGVWMKTKTGKTTFSARWAACMCAEGAIAKAAGVHPSNVAITDAAGALADVIEGQLGWGDGIPEWNDKPGRTQAEVVAALREAARRATGEA